jgi:hypothetical protein
MLIIVAHRELVHHQHSGGTMSVSVRISGKKGKTIITPEDGATVADVVREAAALLGLDGFNVANNVFVADGHEVAADHPADGVTKVDAAPQARLG